jgi:hypothetical protein
MSKLLLGTLVAAMLSLTALVAYNTYGTPDHVCPLSAQSESAASCCDSHTATAPACCTEAVKTTAESACCKEATTATAAKPDCCKEKEAATAAPAEPKKD